jgi:hypothetical protein
MNVSIKDLSQEEKEKKKFDTQTHANEWHVGEVRQNGAE